MSIKGFIVNGVTQKYDYDSLDNKPVIPSGGGVSDDLKQALLQLANNIAYVDANGQDYYQDLYDALYGSTPVPTTYTVTNNLTNVTNSNTSISVTQGNSYTGTLTASSGYTIDSVSITMGGVDVTGTSYSGGTITIANVTGNIVITAVATQRQATLLSIDAVFTQGQAVIYDTDSLDTLKQYLVVTAYWDDSTTSTVASSAYTLSGTLTVGTSTITVSYSGKSDTFNVTVTQHTVPMLYNWDFTESLTDTVQNVTVTSRDGFAPSRDSSGLSFTAAKQQISVPVSLDLSGKTLEIDVASFAFAGNTSYHIRFIMLNVDPTNTMGNGVLIYRSNTAWAAYGTTASTGTANAWSSAWSADLTGTSSDVINAFDGKTVKMVFNSDGHTMSLYLDGTLKGTLSNIYFNNVNMRYISLGGLKTGEQNGGNQFFNAVITGMRIYENT